jgi:hypothetical protein
MITRHRLIGLSLLLAAAMPFRPLSAHLPTIQTDFSVGYRHDNIKWKIVDKHQDPKVISTAEWEQLRTTQAMLSMRGVNEDHIYFRGYADYGKIYGGHLSKKDYTDDPSLNIYSAHAKADRGEAFDLSGGIGYHFSFAGERVTLAPLGGYSYHAMHIRNNDLFVTRDIIDDTTGSRSGTHSKYQTRWTGPWGGLDLTYEMTCNFGLFGSAEYHWVHFKATSHGNTRPGVTHFKQHAHGWGQLYTAGIKYRFLRCWSVSIWGMIERFRTRNGTDRYYFAGGGHASARLQPVHWNSYSVFGAITYRY